MTALLLQPSFKFRVALAFILCCVLGSSLFAETSDLRHLRFRALKLEDDTQFSGSVNDIIQGPQGFIWFATDEGAHRYDGHNIKSFVHDNEDPRSIASSSVELFHLDGQNRLWMGTERGVSVYLPEIESFRNFPLDSDARQKGLLDRVAGIESDSEGQVYAVAESGIIYGFSETESVFHALNDESLGIVKSLDIDPRGRLWIGVNGSVFRFDPLMGEIVQFSEPFQSLQDATNFVESIAYVSDEEIWVATATQGAIVFNSLSEEAVESPRQLRGEGYGHLVKIDEFGNVWLGHSGGLTIRDELTGEVARYHAGRVDGDFPSSEIRSLMQDDRGNVWVGSSLHGVFVANKTKPFGRLAEYLGRPDGLETVVSAVMEDSSGNLWVGRNTSGIDVFPENGGLPTLLDYQAGAASSLPDGTVFSIFQDSRETIWVGVFRCGLARYRPESMDFEFFLHEEGNPNSLSGNDIRGIQEDDTGKLWLLVHGHGLSHFDPESGTFQNYSRDPAKEDSTLVSDWGTALLYASDGTLYYGTDIGLSVVDTLTGEVQNYIANPEEKGGLSNSVVNDLKEDSQGRIWIATSGGVELFDPSSKEFRSWGVKDGLPSRVVQSVVQDADGQMWLGTNRGLVRFNPTDSSMRVYRRSDGLSSDTFSARAVEQGRDDSLYFGTRDGLSYFLPSEIVDDVTPPTVWISDFKVFNRSIELRPGEEGPGVLSKSILLTDRVQLDYDQKVFSVSFVALDFTRSSQSEYAYRLLGFDRKWTQGKGIGEVTYTNLSPGNYTFEVKASNGDGYWSVSPRQLQIVVMPPFWDTLIFRLGVTILLLVICSVIIFWRLNDFRRQREVLAANVSRRTEQLRNANQELEVANSRYEETQSKIQEQNRELMKHRTNLEAMVSQRTKELEKAVEKAERSDRLKTAFLANMSHEIRTPMNAIIGLLDVLQIDTLTDAEREHYSAVIKQSSETLMTLIDDILDLSRIESGEANIQLELCNCDEVCEELFALFRHLAAGSSEGKVELKLVRDDMEGEKPDLDSDFVLSGLDPIRLKQVLTNLLSNAIKFTDSGQILFGYDSWSDETRSGIRFFVTDSGIGIAPEQLHLVFDRFHKLEKPNGRVYRGAGLGLTISKKLTELMGGTISVESELGVGTTFRVEFEREKESPKDLERSAAVDSYLETKHDEEAYLAGKRVLVVEDEEPNFIVLGKYLEKAKAIVVWAKNGVEAVARFDEEEFDLVLLDVKMPLMNGYEVLSHIRSVNTSIPVLMQTAHVMEAERRRSEELGANGFIAKPFTQGSLRSAIEQLQLA
ncbi:two-component regulator propeller domain-containing protein [Pelagicoccus albus]|uniref:two-component regulator propeller domain-containing protein n=1 Tax=Pelagicoccus albus TaxID=415222 RepID=UPI0030DCE0E9